MSRYLEYRKFKATFHATAALRRLSAPPAGGLTLVFKLPGLHALEDEDRTNNRPRLTQGSFLPPGAAW
jgi:hypothetical protein